MENNCAFTFSAYNSNKYEYSCDVFAHDIPKRVDRNFFRGLHTPGRSNEDVQCLMMHFKKPKIPLDIGRVFPNVTRLILEDCGIQMINPEFLQQFPLLEVLDMSKNKLEVLNGNLFAYNKYLREVDFSSNMLKRIEQNVFKGLEKLEKINFSNNTEYHCWYKENDSTSMTFEAFIALTKLKWTSKSKPPTTQKCVTKLHKDIEKFLALDKFKDFTIKVDSRDFKVHKFLLMARSAKLAEMIENNPDAEELQLTDIPVDVIESILTFIYTDQPPKDVTCVPNVMTAAQKLKINELKEVCGEILNGEIAKEQNLESLMNFFNLGLKLECDKLKTRTFVEIKKYFPNRKLKDELVDQPENLKKLIAVKLKCDEARKILEEQLSEFGDEI